MAAAFRGHVGMGKREQENSSDAKLRRFKDYMLTAIMAFCAVAAVVDCVVISLHPSVSSGAQQQAVTRLTEMVLALGAYAVGRKAQT
jgi:hypothetical protein